jgi:hypothetical protein
MVKLLGERKEETQGVQRKTDLCSAEQKKTEQVQEGTPPSQQAAASASFNSGPLRVEHEFRVVSLADAGEIAWIAQFWGGASSKA